MPSSLSSSVTHHTQCKSHAALEKAKHTPIPGLRDASSKRLCCCRGCRTARAGRTQPSRHYGGQHSWIAWKSAKHSAIPILTPGKGGPEVVLTLLLLKEPCGMFSVSDSPWQHEEFGIGFVASRKLATHILHFCLLARLVINSKRRTASLLNVTRINKDNDCYSFLKTLVLIKCILKRPRH